MVQCDTHIFMHARTYLLNTSHLGLLHIHIQMCMCVCSCVCIWAWRVSNSITNISIPSMSSSWRAQNSSDCGYRRAMRFSQWCAFEIETARWTFVCTYVRICVSSHKQHTKQIQLSQNTLNWIHSDAVAVASVVVIVSLTCVSECTLLWLAHSCPLKCAC